MIFALACVLPVVPPEPDADGDGYTVEEGDCDDGRASVYPGATETCDGVDDDCDGTVDVDVCFAYDPGEEDGASVVGESGIGDSVLVGEFDGDTIPDLLAVGHLGLTPGVCLIAGARLTSAGMPFDSRWVIELSATVSGMPEFNRFASCCVKVASSWSLGRRLRKRVIGGCRQSEKHAALAETFIIGQHFCAWRHQPRRRAAEQPAHIAKATRARHENPFANGTPRLGAGFKDAAHRLIARHQRIAHARKMRHAAGPQETLGASADAAVVDSHDNVGLARIGQSETPQT